MRSFIGDQVNYWLYNCWNTTDRGLVLIIIGPTGTGTDSIAHLFVCICLIIGKTTFALSLPGVANYYHGIWSLKNWNNNARYMVFDDMPWDEMGTGHCPDQKALLTGNEDIIVSIQFFSADE